MGRRRAYLSGPNEYGRGGENRYGVGYAPRRRIEGAFPWPDVDLCRSNHVSDAGQRALPRRSGRGQWEHRSHDTRRELAGHAEALTDPVVESVSCGCDSALILSISERFDELHAGRVPALGSASPVNGGGKSRRAAIGELGERVVVGLLPCPSAHVCADYVKYVELARTFEPLEPSFPHVLQHGVVTDGNASPVSTGQEAKSTP